MRDHRIAGVIKIERIAFVKYSVADFQFKMKTTKKSNSISVHTKILTWINYSTFPLKFIKRTNFKWNYNCSHFLNKKIKVKSKIKYQWYAHYQNNKLQQQWREKVTHRIDWWLNEIWVKGSRINYFIKYRNSSQALANLFQRKFVFV